MLACLVGLYIPTMDKRPHLVEQLKKEKQRVSLLCRPSLVIYRKSSEFEKRQGARGQSVYHWP